MRAWMLAALLLAGPSPDPLADLARQIEEVEHSEAAGGAGVAHEAIHHPYPPNPHQHFEPHRHEVGHHFLEAFQLPFMQRAVVAGLLAGAICTWLGMFVLLRRMVFVGVGLAQVASCGVALAVFLGREPLALALLFTLAASVAVGIARGGGVVSPSVRIGFLYLVGGSVAMILLSKSGTGEAEQLEMIQGSLLTIGTHRIGILVLGVLTIAVLHGLGFRQLVAIAFDPIYAALVGVRVMAWNLMFSLALGAGISITIQSCGLLLVFGYLVLPPATGLATGLRLPWALAVAMAVQAGGTILGLWMAYEFDLPGGPMIVALLAASLVVAPFVVRLLGAGPHRLATGSDLD